MSSLLHFFLCPARPSDFPEAAPQATLTAKLVADQRRMGQLPREAASFSSYCPCCFPGVWELVYINNGSSVEKSLLSLMQKILNKLCLCYDLSVSIRFNWEKKRSREEEKIHTLEFTLRLNWEFKIDSPDMINSSHPL